MWFIGDMHGSFKHYLWLTDKMLLKGGQKGLGHSLQVGDLGIFAEADFCTIPIMPNHKFFRGNHDNPALCNQHPNYLGDYGFNKKLDMFWLAGGMSVDLATNPDRLIGVSWWEDEQLDYATLVQQVAEYARLKPRILVSHECPTEVKIPVLSNARTQMLADGFLPIEGMFCSQTEQALQAMLDTHRPEIHIFGHYHHRIELQQNGTRFIGLGCQYSRSPYELMFELPGLEW